MLEDKIKEASEKYAMSDNIPARSQHINIDHIAPTFIAGALSPETKEYWQQGLYTEEDMNKAFDLGFKWSKTDKSEGPLSFLWRMFNQDKKK